MSNDNKDISIDDLGFGTNYEVISITDVPDEFEGTIVNYRVERDENGISRLKFYVDYHGKLVIISYTKIYLSFIGEQLKKLGFTTLSELKGKTFKFKRMPTPLKLKRKVNYNPRHVPIMLTSRKETEEEEEEEEEEEKQEEEEEEEDNVSKIKSKFKSKQ